MAPNLTNLLQHEQTLANEYFPRAFRLRLENDRESLHELLKSNPGIIVLDEIHLQLRDLCKLENPSRQLSDKELDELANAKVPKNLRTEYGVWFYYPWANKIVHLLDEQEFIKVRTIRNLYKITPENQQNLRRKKIGVIGLSVGQSAAITIAMESLAGEIRIADFDHLELSNMNRLRTSVFNLGLPKTLIVAREISEIDPYIKVICFNTGINNNNISTFLKEETKLDLLVEECDSIDIKVLCREHAKNLNIPVIMDTSDRGMLDIERFDKEPDYPLLHGLIDKNVTSEFLSTLKSSEEKFPYILPIIGFENISTQLKASGMQVGKTITTWPQLASDVTHGGALVAFAAKKILCGGKLESGRYYFDFEEKVDSQAFNVNNNIQFEKPLTSEQIELHSSKLELEDSDQIDEETLGQICKAATAAPSAGNNQKWRLHYTRNNLILYVDKVSNFAYSDNFNIASTIGIGCAIENIEQFCNSVGIETNIKTFNTSSFPAVASVSFKRNPALTYSDGLAEFIYKRRTTRSNQVFFDGNPTIYDELKNLNSFDNIDILFIRDRNKIEKIRDLVCKADRIRFTNTQGHQEFYLHELRWNQEDAKKHKDGLDITYFDLTASDLAGLRLAKDVTVIEYLNSFSGGHGFERISSKYFNNSDAIGFVTSPNFEQENLCSAGRFIERTWLHSTKKNLGVFPITVLPMLTSFVYGDNHCFNNAETLEELKGIHSELYNILGLNDGSRIVYMFKTTGVEENYRPSQRHEIETKLLRS